MASNNNLLQPQLPKFTGKNYSQWSIQMKVLYAAQDLWEVVENGFVEPNNQGDLTQQQLTELKETRKKDKKLYSLSFKQWMKLFLKESHHALHQNRRGTLSLHHIKEKKK
ncbi:hypothetical protein CerSpe_165160 [Prunus speciosa]